MRLAVDLHPLAAGSALRQQVAAYPERVGGGSTVLVAAGQLGGPMWGCVPGPAVAGATWRDGRQASPSEHSGELGSLVVTPPSA